MPQTPLGLMAFPMSVLMRAGALVACLGLPSAVQAQGAEPPGLACQQLVAALADAGRVPLQGVHFDFNRASLRPDSLPALVAARDAILTLGGTWSFEGHTDNVGSGDYNQRLSEARALAVRDWMVGAGIDPGRVGFAGFSFDRPIADNATEAGRALNRRVEMVGTVSPDMLGMGEPDGIDPCPATLTPGSHGATAEAPPPVTDWTGSGGQEWLPFSYLMATSYGSAGWGGQTVILPAGSQPQACQALCQAEELCAAFSFAPSGSFFVEDVRCTLMGYGGELFVNRDNTYFEGGVFHVSGLKPDARVLTPESEALAAEILADMAEIAALRTSVRLTAAPEEAPEAWLDVALDGHVPADRYTSFVEIAELDDYNFDWSKSRGGVFVHDMADGRSGQIWTPAPGDYVLRYVIDHPTAGRHLIVAQPLSVRDGATATATPAAGVAATAPAARTGTVEPGIDRPGEDLAQTPMTVADPLMCQALCAGDPDCRAWTYVNPGLQGDQAMCWTKSGVPEGYPNACCTSGVMDQAAAPAPAGDSDAASLTFPATVAPGAPFTVAYTGPIHAGDWIDIITPGNDDDMSGGWSWAWAEGAPVTLTAPAEPGLYGLRYVAEHPQRGRVVLAQSALTVAPAAPAGSAEAWPVAHRCEPVDGFACELRLPEHDIAVTLFMGYGITEPEVYVTAGGAAAERAGFDVVRLSDGQPILTVNGRQVMSAFCQQSVMQDAICVLGALAGDDGAAAGLVFASLTSIAMAAEADAAGVDDPVDVWELFGGTWVIDVRETGHPLDGSPLAVVELEQIEIDDQVRGRFRSSPDFDGFAGLAGEAAAGFGTDGLMRVHLFAETGQTLILLADSQAGPDWLGRIGNPRPLTSATIDVMFRQVAGPTEHWEGAPWMHGEPEGMAAALQIGAAALQGLLGDLEGEDAAMVEMLARIMGGAGGAAPQTAAPPPPSEAMRQLDGVVLGTLTAEEALLLVAPHLED